MRRRKVLYLLLAVLVLSALVPAVLYQAPEVEATLTEIGRITIWNSGSSEVSSAIRIVVNSYALFNSTDFTHIRLQYSNGTDVPFWIEKWDSITYEAIIWVNVTIPAQSNVTITLYNDSSLTESLSNGDAVFWFFDDFEGNALDTNKWTSNGTIVVSDGYVSIAGDSIINSTKSFTYPIVLYSRFRMEKTNAGTGGYGKKLGLNNFDANVDAVEFDWHSGAGTFQTQTWNEGTETINSISNDLSVWGTRKIEWVNASEARFYDGNEQIQVHTTNVPDEPLYVFAESFGSGYVYIDYIFVYPYYDPSVVSYSYESLIEEPTTVYSEEFTDESYPLRDYFMQYVSAGTSTKPTFGINPNYGLYMTDSSTSDWYYVAFYPFVKNQKQSFTAIANFTSIMDDPSKDHGFGFVIGTDASVSDIEYHPVIVLYYSSLDQKLYVKRQISDITTFASPSGSSISDNIFYTVIANVTYDPSDVSITVSAYIKDENGNVIVSLEPTEISNVYPLFGILFYSGPSATGTIYCKNYTVTFIGKENSPDWEILLAPDFNEFDWVGCPHTVFFEGSDGYFYPYNPNDGYIYVTVRLHGEDTDTGKRIDMYKIVGDPTNPENWVFVKSVFNASDLELALMEGMDLIVLNNGTYIAFIEGSTTSTWNVLRLVSYDSGNTWILDKILFSNAKNNHIWVDPDGTIYMMRLDISNTDLGFLIHKSTDLGNTWTYINNFPETGTGGLFKINGTYYIVGRITVLDTRLLYNIVRLWQTDDFLTFTLVENLAEMSYNLNVAPNTPYYFGVSYPDLLVWNNKTYVIGEAFIIDNDPTDDLNDKKQRHLMIYAEPIMTDVTLDIPSAPTPTPYPHFSSVLQQSSITVEPSTSFSVYVTVTNDGSAQGTAELRLKDHNGNVVDTETVTLAAGSSTTVTLSGTAPESEGTYQWTVETYNVDNQTVDDTDTLTLNVQVSPTPTPTPTPTGMFSTILEQTSITVEPEEEFTIEATVTNNGDVSGTAEIRLKDHNGNIVDNRVITLNAGQSITIVLSGTAPESEGTYYWTVETYNVDNETIDDTDILTIEVEERALFPWLPIELPSELNWLWILIAIIVFLAFLKVLFDTVDDIIRDTKRFIRRKR